MRTSSGGTQKSFLCFLICGAIACLLLIACICMGIVSLNYSYWDTYEYYGPDPKTSDLRFNRTLGIFLECWHDFSTDAEKKIIDKTFVKENCVHIPLWLSDNMNKIQGSIIHTRRSHIAMVILALACALVALIIFIVGAIILSMRERKQGYSLFSNKRPWFSLAAICGIICLFGTLVFLFSFVLYHIFKGMEFEPTSAQGSALPRIYSDVYTNNNTISQNIYRYWGSMYYLCWGSWMCLAVATILFFLALWGICGRCCNVFGASSEKARVAPPLVTYDPTKDYSYVHRDFDVRDFMKPGQ